MRTSTVEQIHSRRYATLAVLCLSLLAVVVDGSIVNVTIPTLVRALHASTSSVQWVSDAYVLAMAGLLLSLGSLGDRIGRHRTLAAGLIVFAVGSVLAGLSSSAGELIAARVVMGVGAAAIMPSTLSILTNVFTEPLERAKAIAIWSGVAGLGAAIGPTSGGWLLAHFAWGSVFLVNLPIVAVALMAGRAVVPASRNEHHGRLDTPGALLSLAGVSALVYAVIEAPNNGWASATTLVIAGAGLASLAAFAAVEIRSSHPMVDLRIFTNARFSAASFSVTMVFFALFGMLFLFTQEMQFVLGYSALAAGVRSLPFALTLGVVSQPAAKAATRLGAKVVVTAGLALMGAGMATMSTASAHSTYGFFLPVIVVIGAGMGLAMAPATESIMGALPRAQAGVGSAVNDTTRNLGGALGIAIMGSVASSTFAAHLHPYLGHLPLGVAAQANTSIGAAVGVGGHIPGAAGHQLVDVARQAFVTGADHALLVAVITAAAGALVAARYLPSRAAAAASAPATEPATVQPEFVHAQTA